MGKVNRHWLTSFPGLPLLHFFDRLQYVWHWSNVIPRPNQSLYLLFFFAKTCCKLHVNYAVLCFRFSGKVQDAEMCQCSSSQVPEQHLQGQWRAILVMLFLCVHFSWSIFSEWTVILPVLFSYPAKCFFVWPLFTAYQAKNFWLNWKL